MNATAQLNLAHFPRRTLMLLPEIRKQIPFSKLIDEVLRDMATQSPEGFAALSLTVHYQDGLFEISLDPDPATNSDDCRLWLCVTQCGTICNVMSRLSLLQPNTIPQQLPHFNVLENRIFRLYANGVKITEIHSEVPTQYNRFE